MIPDTPTDEWEANSRKKYPWRFFASWTLPIFAARIWRQFVHEPWYWIKCRLWHQYNVVRCRHLGPTWCDRDHLLVFASFQILEDFIERERPWELQADNITDAIREAYKELNIDEAWLAIREIYDWWKVRRTKGWDDDFDDEDDRMLHKLIDARGVMWT